MPARAEMAASAVFQAETFAKPVTDGASVARRHFEKSVMLCLIINLTTSCRHSILGFRLLLGVLQRFQAAFGRLKRFQPENRHRGFQATCTRYGGSTQNLRPYCALPYCLYCLRLAALHLCRVDSLFTYCLSCCVFVLPSVLSVLFVMPSFFAASCQTASTGMAESRRVGSFVSMLSGCGSVP